RGTGHEAATEHAVELADPAGAVGGILRDVRRDGLGRPRRRHGGGGDRARGGAPLDHRAPGLALGAAAEPLRAGPAALGARETGSGGTGHAASLGAATDT